MALGSDLLLKLIIDAVDKTGPAVRTAREGIQSVSDTAGRLYEAAKTYLNFQIVIGGVQEFIGLGDKWAELKSRIGLATRSQEEFTSAQSALFAVAQETRSELDATVALWTKSKTAVDNLGGSTKDGIDLTRAIAQSFKISGASAEESSAGIQQLGQALGSGVLRGDEFNSVMESSPRLALALANGLNMPITKLRDMAEQGQLTADKVIGALLSQKDVLAAEYAKLPVTVSGAMTQAGNALLKYVGELNDAYGVTQKVAAGIQVAAGHINELGSVVGTVAGVMVGQGLKALSGYAQGAYEAAKAMIAQKAAAEEARNAALQSLQTAAESAKQTAADAQARVGLTQKLVEQAKAELDLAEKKKAASLGSASAQAAEREAAQKLEQAQGKYREAVTAANSASDAATAAHAKHQDALTQTAAKTGLAEKAFGLLNGAFTLLQAGMVGWEIGQFLNKFESVRLAGSYLAEGIAKLGVVWDVFTGKMSAAEGKKALEDIPRMFDDIRKESTDAYQQAQQKAKEFEQSQTSLKSALANVATETKVTAEDIAKLKTKMDEAKAAADAKTAALAKTKEGTEEYTRALETAKEATAKASAATTQYTQALGDAVTQADNEVKASKAHSAQIESEYQGRQKLLQAQLEAAKASGDEAAVVQKLGELKKLEVQQAAAVVQAKQAEANAAFEKAKAVEQEANATGGLSEKEKVAIAEAKAAAAATQDAANAAQAHYQALIRLPKSLTDVRTEQALTTDQITKFKEAAQQALDKLREQDDAYRSGKISAGELAKAHVDAAGKLETYTQALQLHVDQLNAQTAATQREAGLAQQRIQIQIDEANAAVTAAKARGDETTAAQLAVQVKRLEAQQSAEAAKAKQIEADTARQLAQALEEQAKANGVVTQAEQQAIQAAKDAAAAKQLEAEQTRVATQAKNQDADAAQQAANATREATQAARNQSEAQQQANDAMGQGQSVAAGLSDQLRQTSQSAADLFDGMMLGAADFNASWRAIDWGNQTLTTLQDQAKLADAAVARLGTNDLSELRNAIDAATLALAGLDGQKFEGLHQQVEQAKARLADLTQEQKKAAQDIADTQRQAVLDLNSAIVQAMTDYRQAVDDTMTAAGEKSLDIAQNFKSAMDEIHAGSMTFEKELNDAIASVNQSIEDAAVRQAAAQERIITQQREALANLGTSLAQSSETYQTALSGALADTARRSKEVSSAFHDTLEAIQADAVGFSRNLDDSIQAIRRSTMSDEEKRADLLKEIHQQQQDAQAAIAAGNIEEATRLRDLIAASARGLNQEVKDAHGNVILSQKEAGDQAIGILNDLRGINATITQARNEDAKAQQDRAKEAIQEELDTKLNALATERAKREEDLRHHYEEELAKLKTTRDAELQTQAEVHAAQEKRAKLARDIQQQQKEAQEAIRAGNIEEATRLRDLITESARGLNQEVKDAHGNIILSQKEAGQQAIDILQGLQGLNDDIAKGRAQAATKERDRAIQAVQDELDFKLQSLEAEEAAKEAAAQVEYKRKLLGIGLAKAEDLKAEAEVHAQKKAHLEELDYLARKSVLARQKDDTPDEAQKRVIDSAMKDLDTAYQASLKNVQDQTALALRSIADDAAKVQELYDTGKLKKPTPTQPPDPKTGLQGRAGGGPVRKGETYVVTEEGTEGFVDKSGRATVLHGDGPSLWTAPEDGTVIPTNRRATAGPIRGDAPPDSVVGSPSADHSAESASVIRTVEVVHHKFDLGGKTFEAEVTKSSDPSFRQFLDHLSQDRRRAG